MADEPSENKTQHLHLLMAPSEVEAIDDWGFKNRIRTRAEAIRRLCQIALMFDERRDDILDAFKSISDSGLDLFNKTKARIEAGHTSVDDYRLAAEAADHQLAIMSAWPSFRLPTGLVNNLKGEGDLEAIMAEVEAVKRSFDEVALERGRRRGRSEESEDE